jgi:hypothetical protein
VRHGAINPINMPNHEDYSWRARYKTRAGIESQEDGASDYTDRDGDGGKKTESGKNGRIKILYCLVLAAVGPLLDGVWRSRQEEASPRPMKDRRGKGNSSSRHLSLL